MGSFIAQDLALNHPDRVRKMIPDSSAYSIRIPETRSLLAYFEKVAADPSAPVGYRNEAVAMLAWNGTWDRLFGIRKDVMFVVGTNDTATPDSSPSGSCLMCQGVRMTREDRKNFNYLLGHTVLHGRQGQDDGKKEEDLQEADR